MDNIAEYGFRPVKGRNAPHVVPEKKKVASAYQASTGVVNVPLRIGDPVQLVSTGTVALLVVGSGVPYGVVVGIDLDAYPSRLTRVNNGTPRPITVHEDLLTDHFDLVVRFLEQTLRAADWAASNLGGVQAILEQETQSGHDGVAAAYRNNFHRSLHPDLSVERVGQLKLQANFLWLHGFLEHSVDVDVWIDRRPLEAALARRAA